MENGNGSSQEEDESQQTGPGIVKNLENNACQMKYLVKINKFRNLDF